MSTKYLRALLLKNDLLQDRGGYLRFVLNFLPLHNCSVLRLLVPLIQPECSSVHNPLIVMQMFHVEMPTPTMVILGFLVFFLSPNKRVFTLEIKIRHGRLFSHRLLYVAILQQN